VLLTRRNAGSRFGEVVTVFGQQRFYGAKGFGGCLKRFDLLAQLGVLGLLPTQNLVDILHNSSLQGDCKEGLKAGQWQSGNTGLRA
jgi:hypothetical protein